MYSLRHVYTWMGNKVYSPYANFTLGFLFFLEAIFFLPTDPMLVFYCIERRHKAFWYAAIATIGSLLGALMSYAIGFLIWHQFGTAIMHNSLVGYLIKPQTFAYVCEQFKEHDWFALLLAGFTPIPFKAATLTAGFCKVALPTFCACVIFIRAIRFFLIAGVIYLCGNYIKEYIDRYFNLITVIVMIGIVGALLYLKFS